MKNTWATLLAVSNLAHNKVRTLVALAGICFAVTLLFMQLGFLASVSLLAMLVYDAPRFRPRNHLAELRGPHASRDLFAPASAPGPCPSPGRGGVAGSRESAKVA